MLLGEALYTMRRYPAGTLDGHRFVPGAPTSLQLVATVQPLRGEDLIIEGLERTVDAKVVFTEQHLLIADEAVGRAADEVQIDGEWWEVMRIERWPLLSLMHERAIVRRRERQ